MKKVLAIVTLSSLLAACAATQTQIQPEIVSPASVSKATAAGDAPVDSVAVASAHDSTGSIEPSRAEDALPKVPLTADLMYRLLSSEIAYQRGVWQPAFVTLLGAAQETRDPRLARRAAEIAVASKQLNEALSAIVLWRELAPHSEEAAQYFLGYMIYSDKLEAARPVFAQRLKEAQPQARSLMMFQMQRMLARAKDKAAAFSLLEDLMAPYATTPDAHLALALAAFGNNDAARARTEAQAALALKPNSQLSVLTLAQVIQDKAEAAKALTAFLDAHPNARDVRIAYARLLTEDKQYDKARSEFELLVKAQPEDLTSLYVLGILCMQTNDPVSAEKYLISFLDLLAKRPNDDDHNQIQAWLALSQIAEDRKDPDAALKWLSKIDSGEAYLGAQIKRAQIMFKRGDLTAARAVLENIKSDDENEQAQILLAEGQLLRDANQLPEALQVLEAGLKKFPTNTDLLYDYAMMAEKSDKLGLMEASLRKIMELSPKNQHAYNALGYTFAERNIRLPEAVTLIERARQLAPDDPFIMDSMGWVQFRLGKLKEAEDLLRHAYELRADPDIGVHLGEVLWVKGQKEDAQKLWRDANTKDPKNDTLKSTLLRLHVRL